jgi:hypothetical protein
MWMNDRPLMVRHSFLYRSLNHLPARQGRKLYSETLAGQTS